MFYSLDLYSMERFCRYVDLYLLILLIFNLMLIVKNFKLNSRLKVSNEKLCSLENSNQIVSVLNDNIRGFKHDFNNIVQILGGYICLNDVEGLKKYYKSLTTDFYSIKNMNLINLKDINNSALFSLISNKISMANEHSVEMNVISFADLRKIDVNMFEYCRILGIIIDNAIEAAENCNKKLVNIKFYEDNSGNFIHCLVENTYMDKQINIKTIYKKNYSTKSNNGNRGLGLWNVRMILRSNHNIRLITKKDDVFFKQTLSGICKSVKLKDIDNYVEEFRMEELV